MSILLFLLGLILFSFGAFHFFHWVLYEPPEDDFAMAEMQNRRGRDFYNPRTWAALHRWLRIKPPLLRYRRDSRGRFRKLS